MDSDAGRDFKGLDARATQEALVEELTSEESEETSVKDQVTDSELEQETVEDDVTASDDREAMTSGDDEAAQEETPDEDVVSAQADETAEEPVAETDGEDAPEQNDAAQSDDAEQSDDVNAEQETAEAPEAAAPVEWTEEDLAEQSRMLEALLFAAFEPLDKKSIVDRLPAGAPIDALIERVKTDYENRGVNLRVVDGKFYFATAPDVAHVLQKEKTTQRKLSRAALETLAIIAYHQPCTRADIEDVRGVQVAKGSLDQLLEIGWVKLRGKRRDVPGRPTLYGTTQAFLEHFGLESVSDLPGLADLKAAGLLDARLPPGFSVPTPTEAEDDEDDGEGGEEGEFAQDFLEEEESAESADSVDEAADI